MTRSASNPHTPTLLPCSHVFYHMKSARRWRVFHKIPALFKISMPFHLAIQIVWTDHWPARNCWWAPEHCRRHHACILIPESKPFQDEWRWRLSRNFGSIAGKVICMLKSAHQNPLGLAKEEIGKWCAKQQHWQGNKNFMNEWKSFDGHASWAKHYKGHHKPMLMARTGKLIRCNTCVSAAKCWRLVNV